MLCEVQKDACAEYYAVCTETFKWSPCIPKPGSEDPTCGGETDASSDEDTVATPEDSWDRENTGEERRNEERINGGSRRNETIEGDDTAPKKVVIIQEEPAGCQKNGASVPFGVLTPLLLFALLCLRRSAIV